MTDADHCAQNALAECMNGILKREFLLGLKFSSFKEALKAVDQAIRSYNFLRIHGELNGETPHEVHSAEPSKPLIAWLKEISRTLPAPQNV
ncbi:MAG: integrase core domain-containing protein [Deltaproteobacteria bacterium]|nr:integrase core domain-containing protein [Deltaproteobacteria bacterium]